MRHHMVPSDAVYSGIRETAFDILMDSDIEKMSACEVIQPEVYDAMGNTVTGGLYDPRMGPSNKFEDCKTCN